MRLKGVGQGGNHETRGVRLPKGKRIKTKLDSERLRECERVRERESERKRERGREGQRDKTKHEKNKSKESDREKSRTKILAELPSSHPFIYRSGL